MELIKQKYQYWTGHVYYLRGYNGVCHNCNTPVQYRKPIHAIKIHETKAAIVYALLTRLRCPACRKLMDFATIYKSLNITEELKNINVSP